MRLNELTVILPTKNEERNILAFLESLPDEIALVVVDASQDATISLIAGRRPERTQIIRHPGRIAQARQIGAEVARTPWLLFTDADVVFAPDYFAHLNVLAHCDAAYGPKLSTTGFVNAYRLQTFGQCLAHRVLQIPAASGSNLLVSRAAFFASGGFDLRLTCNEDSELAWRVKRHGYRVCWAPELIVYARDHRRLQRGAARKMLHSLLRCTLLYFGLMPERWRSADWGYWPPTDKFTTEPHKKGNLAHGDQRPC